MRHENLKLYFQQPYVLVTKRDQICDVILPANAPTLTSKET